MSGGDLGGGGPYRFETAVCEKRLGGMVADVAVRRADRELLVEIKVTHACGPEKLEKIRNADLAVVEIDLGKLPRNADRQEIEAAILRDAPRAWLHNPKEEAARKRHAGRVE